MSDLMMSDVWLPILSYIGSFYKKTKCRAKFWPGIEISIWNRCPPEWSSGWRRTFIPIPQSFCQPI